MYLSTHDAGDVDLGDDRGCARDVGRLALRAGHAAKAGGDIELAGEVALLRDAQHQTSGVEKGVEGAVDDALRADVHPAAGGHLAVVGDAQSGGAVEGFLIVEHADHQAVGDDDARRGLVGFEQAQRVAGFDDEGLVVGEHLEVFFNQAVLHPVLADLSGLAVGGQLIGVEGDVEVEVVVDHDLEGLALDAVALVLVDRFAVDFPLRAEAVAVDAAVLLQLLRELLGHLFVVVGVDVAQGVFDGELLIGLGEVGFAVRRTADALDEGRVFGKLIVQFNHHCFFRFVVHKVYLLFYFFY